jgi:hypothetical protein
MNPSLYHKFFDISIIPAGLNPIEANKHLCRVLFRRIGPEPDGLVWPIYIPDLHRICYSVRLKPCSFWLDWIPVGITSGLGLSESTCVTQSGRSGCFLSGPQEVWNKSGWFGIQNGWIQNQSNSIRPEQLLNRTLILTWTGFKTRPNQSVWIGPNPTETNEA